MTTIPTIDFFGTQVTRMILGDNPFNGHSYIPDIYSEDEMLDYYTAEQCVRALFEAEENGINTYMALASPFILRVIRQYRNEGGKMRIMFQSYPPIDFAVNVSQMMACNPIAIYHQGGTFDYMCEEGQTEELHKRLEVIRSAGVAVGLGTHVPETVLQAEREKWDVDFYMVCLYNARKTQRGQQSGFITGKPKQLVFYPDDRFLMFEAIKEASKPCIAFKVFAGGQIFYGKNADEIPEAAETAIKETYENIKPDDMICLGVFQKEKNQIKENAEIVKKILCR
ncbi:MAG: hypothetical protein FWD71_02345 [Oscillospiraceae bacterium]|nr:hypothetical protein [Oscillospiraceae bacterium]